MPELVTTRLALDALREQIARYRRGIGAGAELLATSHHAIVASQALLATPDMIADQMAGGRFAAPLQTGLKLRQITIAQPEKAPSSSASKQPRRTPNAD